MCVCAFARMLWGCKRSDSHPQMALFTISSPEAFNEETATTCNTKPYLDSLIACCALASFELNETGLWLSGSKSMGEEEAKSLYVHWNQRILTKNVVARDLIFHSKPASAGAA